VEQPAQTAHWPGVNRRHLVEVQSEVGQRSVGETIDDVAAQRKRLAQARKGSESEKNNSENGVVSRGLHRLSATSLSQFVPGV